MTDYTTLEEIRHELTVNDDDAVDDAVLGSCITAASRAIDSFCDRWFYAAPMTRVYDAPADGTVLWLGGDDWLAVSAFTNGDGSTIAGSAAGVQYLPANHTHFNSVRLRPSSGVTWLPMDGDYSGAITVAGSAGYVDRAATDPESARVVSNTNRAAIITAISYYRKRRGLGVDAATVTAAGVILTPQGLPRDAVQLIEGYRRNP